MICAARRIRWASGEKPRRWRRWPKTRIWHDWPSRRRDMCPAISPQPGTLAAMREARACETTEAVSTLRCFISALGSPASSSCMLSCDAAAQASTASARGRSSASTASCSCWSARSSAAIAATVSACAEPMRSSAQRRTGTALPSASCMLTGDLAPVESPEPAPRSSTSV
eukprot:scaffold277444_cov28-Tisochrysis_lutea.AAC.4